MKTDASAKTIIDLKGSTERVELVLLTSMLPLWGIVFPLIGLATLASYVGVILIVASFFCFLYFLHLNNSHFSFEENGIRLPGVDHRLLPYANIKSIYLDKPSPFFLAVEYEYVPLKSVFKRNTASGPLVVQLFEIRHMTEDSARQLSELFSSNLSSYEISPDVHDKLLNWHPKTAELAENKEFDLIKPALQCMISCSQGFCKIWLVGWAICALIAYPVKIVSMLTGSDVDQQLLAAVSANCLQAFGVVWAHCPQPVREGIVGWLVSATHK